MEFPNFQIPKWHTFLNLPSQFFCSNVMAIVFIKKNKPKNTEIEKLYYRFGGCLLDSLDHNLATVLLSTPLSEKTQGSYSGFVL